MRKKNGQALVEFVVILPVLLFLIFGAIDLGNVLYKKYHLESDLDYIVDLYHEKKESEINSYASSHNFKVSILNDTDFATIEVIKEVSIMTPGLNLILKNPHKIVIERVVRYEK